LNSSSDFDEGGQGHVLMLESWGTAQAGTAFAIQALLVLFSCLKLRGVFV
jgi:hypothetical protein